MKNLTIELKALTFHLIILNDQIIHLSFSPDSHQQAIKKISRQQPIFPLKSGPEKDKLITEFKRYFAGQPYNLPWSTQAPFYSSGSAFQQEVWELIRAIPRGKVMTYGELAAELGGKGYARAVGRACNTNPLALIVPCHRVVGVKDIGGFAGGRLIKKRLLEIEGIFDDGGQRQLPLK
ncbi:MAG: MGMT family protein [Proteobacteria bacterium]|nr:MGMT family protein [Pseudomonadota bacterium]MBU1715806.1 MGMT family protein [Pseudomonadota bacterium]